MDDEKAKNWIFQPQQQKSNEDDEVGSNNGVETDDCKNDSTSSFLKGNGRKRECHFEQNMLICFKFSHDASFV